MKILNIINNKDLHYISDANAFFHLCANKKDDMYIMLSYWTASSICHRFPENKYICEILDLSMCLVDSPRIMLWHVTTKRPEIVRFSSCKLDAHPFNSQSTTINRTTFLDVPRRFYPAFIEYLDTLDSWLSFKKHLHMPYEKIDNGVSKYTFFCISHSSLNYSKLYPEYYHPTNKDLRKMIESPSTLVLRDIVSLESIKTITYLNKSDITIISTNDKCEFNGTDGLLSRKPNPFASFVARVIDKNINPLHLYTYLISTLANQIRNFLSPDFWPSIGYDLPIPQPFPETIIRDSQKIESSFHLAPKQVYTLDDYYLIELAPTTKYIDMAKEYAEDIEKSYSNNAYQPCMTSVRSLLELFLRLWASEDDGNKDDYILHGIHRLDPNGNETNNYIGLSEYAKKIWPDPLCTQRKWTDYIINSGNYAHPNKAVSDKFKPTKDDADRCIDYMAQLIVHRYQLV